jgi:polyribonucleotide nucleotidyltransferase
MMAAGVPIERPVAGVAMGLLLDESGGGGEPIVLTDILGSEDALGTMDFKVAGDEQAITAFQLDIKCEGLSIALMRRALEQARQGRLHILNVMRDACPGAASRLPPSVPRLIKRKIDASKVGKLIGPGGATINGIIADSGVENISVDGNSATVCISGTDDDNIDAAIKRIEEIAGTGGGQMPAPAMVSINVGDAFPEAQVKSIVPFGIFCELVDGVDGFCHISELSDSYIDKIDDVEVAVGDKMAVKVTEFNQQKRQYRFVPTEALTINESSEGGGRGRGRGRGRGGRGGGRGSRGA